jgi:hypothetical protein
VCWGAHSAVPSFGMPVDNKKCSLSLSILNADEDEVKGISISSSSLTDAFLFMFKDLININIQC